MTERERYFRALSRSLDPLDLLAAADILCEDGDEEGAAMFRRRSAWAGPVAVGIAEEEQIKSRKNSGDRREVAVVPGWVLDLWAAKKTIRYRLYRVESTPDFHAEGEGFSISLFGLVTRHEATSGWLTRSKLSDATYRRNRIFALADLSAIIEAQGEPAGVVRVEKATVVVDE
jgi:hypothetical protein